MNKNFLFHSFLWCILIGMAFTVFGQNASFNRAPVNNEVKHSINFGNHIDGTTTGYGADGIGNMWYSVDIPTGALTQIGATGGILHQGGDFDDGSGTFYCTLSPATLATVNTATGAETVVATITGVTSGQTITAMAWDHTTSTMFLGTTDITTSQLYTLNLGTGVATLVGTIGQSGLIALGCDCDGNLYSIDLVTDNLWSINPTTGVGTAIGPLGYDVNFAQDADFDPADGTFYLAAYNNTTSSGQLRTVNLTTGTSTLVLDWGALEITDFGIEGSCGPPCPVGAPTNPSPANGATDVAVTGNTLSWTNGAGTTGVEVWFDGVMVYDSTPISSYSLAPQEPLMYASTYSWKVVDKNDTCGVSATWSFTTMQNPLLANLYCDDFEAGSGSWTITNDGGTCTWAISTLSRPYTMPATASGNVFAADADLCGSGTSLLSTATLTAPLDFSGVSSAYIEFDNDWRTISTSDEAYVEGSSDGGSTWVALWSQVGVSVRNTHEVVDASVFDGQPSVLLRMRSIQPGWDWWWAVDNFCVFGVIPVEFTSFAANVNDGNVNLTWSTATETNNQGFEVQRSSNGTDYEAISFVQGHGTTTQTQFYAYTDKNVAAGSYTYRLKQVDFDGTYDYSNTIEVDVNAPKVFSLDQNYPNPFNPSTKITFNLAIDSKVSLKVFDILGQEVMTLLNGNLVAGGHEVNFNASGLNSGVYFYRIDATGANGTNFSDVKKMILTK